jgi:hypothetical protein
VRLTLLEKSVIDRLVRSTLKASATASPDKISTGAGDVEEASQWWFVGLLSSPMERPYYQQTLQEYRTQTPARAKRRYANEGYLQQKFRELCHAIRENAGPGRRLALPVWEWSSRMRSARNLPQLFMNWRRDEVTQIPPSLGDIFRPTAIRFWRGTAFFVGKESTT